MSRKGGYSAVPSHDAYSDDAAAAAASSAGGDVEGARQHSGGVAGGLHFVHSSGGGAAGGVGGVNTAAMLGSFREAQQDVDKWLLALYEHYHRKGLWHTVVDGLLFVLTVLFVIVFTTVLALIDWVAVFVDPVPSVNIDLEHPPVAVVVFFVIAMLFFVAQVAVYVRRVSSSVGMYRFLRDQLHLKDSDIRSLHWSEVVEALMRFQQRHPISLRKPVLDVLDISNRVLRFDNFMIGLVNTDRLRPTMPWPLSSRPMFTSVIEFHVRKALQWVLFDESGRVREVNDRNTTAYAQQLRRVFVFLGLAHLVLMPFVLVLGVVYIVFKYGEETYSNPGSVLGARSWNLRAQWTFREYNEMPHGFHHRLRLSEKPAQKYISLFPSRFVVSVARFVAFVFGSVAVVLIAIGVLDNDVMNNGVLFGRSFLWFFGMCATLLATARSFVIDYDSQSDPNTVAKKVADYTHYMPRRWQQRCHRYSVYAEFTTLFEYKVVLLAYELLSVLVAPLVLWGSLAVSAGAIVEFFRDNTSADLPGMGRVCVFAAYDFRRAAGNADGTSAPPGARVVAAQTGSHEGKMERSFLYFKLAHPTWRHEDGDRWMQRMAGDAGVAVSESLLLAKRAQRHVADQEDLGESLMSASRSQLTRSEGDLGAGTDAPRSAGDDDMPAASTVLMSHAGGFGVRGSIMSDPASLHRSDTISAGVQALGGFVSPYALLQEGGTRVLAGAYRPPVEVGSDSVLIDTVGVHAMNQYQQPQPQQQQPQPQPMQVDLAGSDVIGMASSLDALPLQARPVSVDVHGPGGVTHIETPRPAGLRAATAAAQSAPHALGALAARTAPANLLEDSATFASSDD